MKQFFKSYTFKAFLAVLAVLLCGSILAVLTTEKESPFTSAVNFVFTPVNRAAAKTAEELGKLRLRFRSAAYYERQAEDLRKKLAESREKVVDYEQLQQKVEDIKSAVRKAGEAAENALETKKKADGFLRSLRDFFRQAEDWLTDLLGDEDQ